MYLIARNGLLKEFVFATPSTPKLELVKVAERLTPVLNQSFKLVFKFNRPVVLSKSDF